VSRGIVQHKKKNSCKAQTEHEIAHKSDLIFHLTHTRDCHKGMGEGKMKKKI